MASKDDEYDYLFKSRLGVIRFLLNTLSQLCWLVTLVSERVIFFPGLHETSLIWKAKQQSVWSLLPGDLLHFILVG